MEHNHVKQKNLPCVDFNDILFAPLEKGKDLGAEL